MLTRDELRRCEARLGAKFELDPRLGGAGPSLAESEAEAAAAKADALKAAAAGDAATAQRCAARATTATTAANARRGAELARDHLRWRRDRLSAARAAAADRCKRALAEGSVDALAAAEAACKVLRASSSSLLSLRAPRSPH